MGLIWYQILSFLTKIGEILDLDLHLYSNGHNSLNFWTRDLRLGSKFSLGHCLDGWTMTKWIRVDQKIFQGVQKNFHKFCKLFFEHPKKIFGPPYSTVLWLSLLGNDLRKI